MSNVLIGIIGVILFIGLALAGALILGDDFRSANNSSRAAALVATTQQVASAGEMYQLKTGTQIGSERDNTGVAWLVPRFLKTNPLGSSFAAAPSTYNYGPGKTVAYIQMGADEKSKDVCGEVQRSMGQIAGDAPTMTTMMDMAVAQTKWQTGCVFHTTSLYTIYSAI